VDGIQKCISSPDWATKGADKNGIVTYTNKKMAASFKLKCIDLFISFFFC